MVAVQEARYISKYSYYCNILNLPFRQIHVMTRSIWNISCI